METIVDGLNWIGDKLLWVLTQLPSIAQSYYTWPGDLILSVAGVEAIITPGQTLISIVLSTLVWWMCWQIIKNQFSGQSRRY